MTRDFTLSMYTRLIRSLKDSGYSFCPVREMISSSQNSPIVCLRHDVDKHPQTALDMAREEQKLGVRSTYYFRHVPSVFKPEIMKEIESMGHEVGYHYETLSKTNGDVDKAKTLFKNELEELREHAHVETICMHGRPMSSHNNLSLWTREELSSLDGITGEAYLSADFDKWLYFTDTGRRWDRKYSVRDNAPSAPPGLKNTGDVMEYISKNSPTHVYILSHPNRWPDNFGPWITELVAQNIKNPLKAILRRAR